MTKEQELKKLQEDFAKTEDFLESIEILSRIEDLKIELGLVQPRKVCNTNNDECLSCGS